MKTGSRNRDLLVRVSRLPLKNTRLWCNGSITDSKPVGQGSNPWGRAGNRALARPLGSEFYQRKQPGEPKDPSAYGQPVPGEIPGESTETCSPVVQRQRRLVHIQETMVRFHPGLLTMPRYANRQSGSAQNRGFAGSIPALGTGNNTSSWSSGVLACLSRRRSWVQIPSGTLSVARCANPVERPSSNLGGWGFESLSCYSMGRAPRGCL